MKESTDRVRKLSSKPLKTVPDLFYINFYSCASNHRLPAY
jgi:hypothetical protein